MRGVNEALLGVTKKLYPAPLFILSHWTTQQLKPIHQWTSWSTSLLPMGYQAFRCSLNHLVDGVVQMWTWTSTHDLGSQRQRRGEGIDRYEELYAP